ncbi:hypothetical protein [Spirosoma pulveris]
MKTVLLFVVTSFLGWFVEGDGLSISDQEVKCVISQNTTESQLQEFKTELWEKKNIRFDVERLDFTADKRISRIKISVDCNDGFKGTAQMVFKDNNSKMNFYRIYDEKAESPFGIGELSSEK